MKWHGQEPQAQEFDHAVALVHECERWCASTRKSVVCLQIDAVCMFDAGEGPCGAPLAASVVLVDEEGANALTLCKHHAGVMMLAVSRERGDNGACLEGLGDIEAEPNEAQIKAVRRWLAQHMPWPLDDRPPLVKACSIFLNSIYMFEWARLGTAGALLAEIIGEASVASSDEDAKAVIRKLEVAWVGIDFLEVFKRFKAVIGVERGARIVEILKAAQKEPSP